MCSKIHESNCPWLLCQGLTVKVPFSGEGWNWNGVGVDWGSSSFPIYRMRLAWATWIPLPLSKWIEFISAVRSMRTVVLVCSLPWRTDCAHCAFPSSNHFPPFRRTHSNAASIFSVLEPANSSQTSNSSVNDTFDVWPDESWSQSISHCRRS